MKRTFNGTTFEEITYIYDGEELEGLLIHDEADENHDGDAIIGNGCELPETEEEAATILANEYGETCYRYEGGKYVIE